MKTESSSLFLLVGAIRRHGVIKVCTFRYLYERLAEVCFVDAGMYILYEIHFYSLVSSSCDVQLIITSSCLVIITAVIFNLCYLNVNLIRHYISSNDLDL